MYSGRGMVTSALIMHGKYSHWFKYAWPYTSNLRTDPWQQYEALSPWDDKPVSNLKSTGWRSPNLPYSYNECDGHGFCDDDVIKWKRFPHYCPFVPGNSPVTCEIPSQRPVTRSFGAFFDLRLNIRLSKQSRRWWFGIPSRSIWRHCNAQGDSSDNVITVSPEWWLWPPAHLKAPWCHLMYAMDK